MNPRETDNCQSNRCSYQCPQCDFTGKNESALRLHITRRHVDREKKPLRCRFPACEYRTTNKHYLSGHVTRMHGENSDRYGLHTCDQCDFKTYKKSQFHIHIATHGEGKPFVCDFPSCNFRTKRLYQLKRHSKYHETDQDKLKVYSCEFCGYRCKLRSNLLRHVRIHTGEKPFACEHPGCNYRSRWIQNLRTHSRKHDPDKMFRCDFPRCRFRTALGSTLKYHQDRHNPERKRNLQCPLCPKTFAVKACLTNHIQGMHTTEKRTACKFCDSAFSSVWNLRMHTIKAHATQVSGVKTILKKYQCTACDFCNVRKAVVLQHHRSHSFIKSFACDKCEYRATRKSYLIVHQGRCSGIPRVRSVKCLLCKKRFFGRSNLSAHVKNVHRTGKLHTCPNCEFVTKYPANLRNHLGKQHADESTETRTIDEQIRAARGRPVRSKKSMNVHTFNATKGGGEKVERKFKCDFLGCTFSTDYYYSLSSHQRVHNPKLKNIRCPLCARKFFKQYLLNSHIRCFHAKEKPFKCGECDYSASNSGDVQRHKRRKHSGNTVRKPRTWDTRPARITVPLETLGVKQFFSCPFCNWMHKDYMTIVRHTVFHRIAVVTLDKKNLMFA